MLSLKYSPVEAGLMQAVFTFGFLCGWFGFALFPVSFKYDSFVIVLLNLLSIGCIVGLFLLDWVGVLSVFFMFLFTFGSGGQFALISRWEGDSEKLTVKFGIRVALECSIPPLLVNGLLIYDVSEMDFGLYLHLFSMFGALLLRLIIIIMLVLWLELFLNLQISKQGQTSEAVNAAFARLSQVELIVDSLTREQDQLGCICERNEKLVENREKTL
jgi:hypothetical protein